MCEGVTVRYTTLWRTLSGVISRLSFIAARLLLVFRFKLRLFYPYSLWIVSCLDSPSYWHDLIVLVRNRTKAAWIYYFSAPTIVTLTRLFGTLQNVLPLFFSKTPTHQSIHNLNIPHSHQQHAAVQCCTRWISWLLGKLLCCRYYSSPHYNTPNAFKFKRPNDNCTHTKGHVRVIIQLWVLQFYSAVGI